MSDEDLDKDVPLEIITLSPTKLTKKQQMLVEEIEEIVWLFALEYQNLEYLEAHERTLHLEVVRNKIIRGQVIVWYTLVDEWLSIRLSDYFFGREKSSAQLWRTKRFQNFNHYFLEEMSLMQKLRFVKAISKIPKAIVSDIERLNALRNGLAHALFPQKLKKSKPVWKGKDIFTLEGAKQLSEDMHKISAFFYKLLGITNS